MSSSFGPCRFVSAFFCLVLLLIAPRAFADPAVTFTGIASVVSTGGISVALPFGVVGDAAGNLYIADAGADQIVKLDLNGKASVLAINGLSPQLNGPSFLAMDGSGNLYITDTGNNRIVEVSPTGAATVVSTPSITLNAPNGLAVDASGNLYIADTGNGITKVSSAGGAAVMNIKGLTLSLTVSPGLAVDASGNLYVTDAGNNRIVEVSPSGAGSVVATPGLTLNSPLAVAVDSSGTVYISDAGNARIVQVAGGTASILNTGSISVSVALELFVGPSGTLYVADLSAGSVVEIQPNAVDFGHLTLGSTTKTSFSLPIAVQSGANLTDLGLTTLGTGGLDFQPTAATTCLAGTTNAATCIIGVQFSPVTPGLRQGSMVLSYSVSGTPYTLNVPLHGIADAPVATISPGVASVVSTSGAALNEPFQIALDGSGNMYVADDDSNNVLKIPAGGGPATIVDTGSILVTQPGGVAVDGAGNLFITDEQNSSLIEVPVSGSPSIVSISGLSTGLNYPTALAIDGAGDLFIMDYGNGRVVKLTPAGVGSVVPTGSYTFNRFEATGVAVDLLGTVYIADSANNRVIQVTASGVASLVSLGGLSPLNYPLGVTVDGMGNLYIADSYNSRIIEVTTAGVASVVPTPGLTLSSLVFGAAVDPSGNILIADLSNNRIVSVNRGNGQLSYQVTNVGQTSTDSPQTATVTNLGDQPLVFSTDPAYTLSFPQNGNDTNLCSSSTTLAAGQTCDVSANFTPQSAGSLSANIAFTDNNFNTAGSAQQVAVSGTGIYPGDTTSTAVVVSPSPAIYGQTVNVTATVTDTTSGNSATVPSGVVTFTDTFGATTTTLSGGAAVTLSNGHAALSGITLNGIGIHTITASYAGVASTFVASTNTAAIAMNQETVTVAGPATQPVAVTSGQAGSVPFVVTGVSGAAVPTGTLGYTIKDASNATVASGTIALTAGSSSATANVPLASTLASGSYTVSGNYSGDSNYVASAVTVQVQVSQITPAINWAASGTVSYGSSLGGVLNAAASNGGASVAGTFAYTATASGGVASAVTNTTVLPAGSYTLTAVFTPTDAVAYKQVSATSSLTVGKIAPAITLASSASTVLAQGGVTLTATVSSTVSQPTGTVSFFDGASSTAVGTSPVSAGVATLTLSTLAAGSHSITAIYSGDANFVTLTSSAVTETIVDFSLSAMSGSTLPTSPGGTATYTVTFSPIGATTFPAAVNLSVSGLPAGASYTLTPATVTAGAGSTNMTLAVVAPTQTATLRRGARFGRGMMPIALGVLLLPFSRRMRRSSGRLGRAVSLTLLLLAGAGVMAGLTGCGSSTIPPSQPLGVSYTLTVTGTSGQLSHTTTVTLDVD